MMDGNLAATAVDTTTRILILEVAVIMTALFAALTTGNSRQRQAPEDKQVGVHFFQFLVGSMIRKELLAIWFHRNTITRELFKKLACLSPSTNSSSAYRNYTFRMP